MCTIRLHFGMNSLFFNFKIEWAFGMHARSYRTNDIDVWRKSIADDILKYLFIYYFCSRNKLIEKLIVQSQFHFGFKWMNNNRSKTTHTTTLFHAFDSKCLGLLLAFLFSNYFERINLFYAFWYWILKYDWRVYFNPHTNNNSYYVT